MPRKPDPGLEDRILNAAQVLWKRGGDKALTLRAVAKVAGTNTPAVYRRFKDRKDLVRGLLRRFQVDLGERFSATRSIEESTDVYLDYLLRHPHVYELVSAHGGEITPRGRPGRRQPIREMRPTFALLEDRLAERLGGAPEDHTRLGLALWALTQGTASVLLSKTIPEGHEEELRSACRTAVKVLLDGADKFS